MIFESNEPQREQAATIALDARQDSVAAPHGKRISSTPLKLSDVVDVTLMPFAGPPTPEELRVSPERHAALEALAAAAKAYMRDQDWPDRDKGLALEDAIDAVDEHPT